MAHGRRMRLSDIGRETGYADGREDADDVLDDLLDEPVEDDDTELRWRAFDYHESPPGTLIDARTGRLRNADPSRSDRARTELARSRHTDPDVVLRVARSSLSEAAVILESFAMDFRTRGNAFIFRTPEERRLAEELLEPLLNG